MTCFSFRYCSQCRYNLSAMVACYNKYRHMKTLFNCKSFLLLQFLNWSKRGKHNPFPSSLCLTLTCLPLPPPPTPSPPRPSNTLTASGRIVRAPHGCGRVNVRMCAERKEIHADNRIANAGTIPTRRSAFWKLVSINGQIRPLEIVYGPLSERKN